MRNFVEECKRLADQGAPVEQIVAHLRVIGCSKVKSIVALAEALSMDLNKAKETVHFSKTWSDTRDRDEDLHRVLEHVVSKNE